MRVRWNTCTAELVLVWEYELKQKRFDHRKSSLQFLK